MGERKGPFGRVAGEIRHWMRRDWPLSDVAAHYDHLADEYDFINEPADAHFRRFTDALRLAPLPDGARVLELFARTGEGMAYFHQQARIASAVCADVSPRMGERCQARLRACGLGEKSQWVLLADYTLPFDDGEFDVVFCLETVEHVARPERLVAELGRVICPGGVLVISTPNVLWEPLHALAAITGLHHSEGPHRFIRLGRLKAAVEAAGFCIEHAETVILIPAGPDWLVRWGRWLEDRLGHRLMEWVGLRRFLICRKLGPVDGRPEGREDG